jgi:hypothetical protein
LGGQLGSSTRATRHRWGASAYTSLSTIGKAKQASRINALAFRLFSNEVL